MARREGAKAAGDDGHSAKLGPGLVHHIGAGGILLAVLTITPLQVVVRAGNGHLHGCTSVERDVEKVQMGQTKWRPADVPTSVLNLLIQCLQSLLQSPVKPNAL